MRRGAKAALVGGVFAAMVGGAGFGAYSLVNDVTGDGGSADAGPAPVKSGPPTGGEVRETAREFLDAWAAGDARRAAGYTNDDASALRALTGYREDAHISEVKLTPKRTSGTHVPFAVSATVSYKGHSQRFAYDSRLTVVRGETTGRALVDWSDSVLHPSLEKGDRLVTSKAAAPPLKMVDRAGVALRARDYPSLGPMLDALRAKYGAKAGGTPGVDLYVRPAGGGREAVTQTLLTLKKGKAGTLPTTLSAGLQKAAERAVLRYDESSVVALKPSTGEVLAVANNRKDAFNAAFLGKVAPGSTMKIVTAAMLIDKGVTKAAGPAPCPADATWQSQTFHNLTGMVPNESATFSESFARSCNTAFVKLIDEDGLTDASLTEVAQNNFGLGRGDWKVGVPSFDGAVPPSPGPDRAANAIGQGKVLMSPLDMASVTATAMTGSFRQPVIVPRSLDGRELATARGLPASTVAQLRQMMHRTAVGGTGARAMASLTGDIGAKTGSAERDGQAKSDSWFTGYRGDVAAAAMTEQGGHGGDAAGPIVADILRAG
ncbi:penicillin-binding transpeptidase domain-containing protein [Streptomyces huasconensis]|uniref:penicillin-binding transpeptidase domain-containing protein n=1 Tax=Streptomyces huasconensis TaxID=1854574 RepID=UPI0036FFD82A